MMMSRFHVSFGSCFLSLAVIMVSRVTARAQEPGTLSLSSQLARVRLSPFQTVIIVEGNEKVEPTPDNAGVFLGELAKRAGLSIYRFGDVTALASPRRTRLLQPPKAVDVMRDLPADEAVTYFLCSLTDTQWQQVPRETGLEIRSLNAEQRALISRFIPSGTVPVHRNQFATEEQPDRDVSLEMGRIRLGRRTSIFLHATGPDDSQNLITFFPMPALATNTPRYEIAWGKLPRRTTMFGNPTKTEEANRQKPGDMDFATAQLQCPVSLSGVKTIRDCMQRITDATGIEVYADRRCENRTVTIAGKMNVPAASVLQALALECGGTYRRVATAFVLTDDRIGCGMTYVAWKEWEKVGEEQRRHLLVQASEHLLAHRSLTELDSFGDAIGITEAQRSQRPTNAASNLFVDVEVPQKDLTSRQWEAVRQMRDTYVAQSQKEASKSGATFATPNIGGVVHLSSTPSLELVVDTLDGPVDLNINFRASLPDTAVPLAETPPVDLSSFSTRAIFARPTSTAELDRLLALLTSSGLNQLWLAPAPVSKNDPALAETFEYLLAYARRKTQVSGIQLFATHDIFRWNRDDVDDSAAELDMRGRNSLVAEGSEKTVRVSPFVPQVWDHTRENVASEADHSADGLIWCAGIHPGYEAPVPALAGAAVYAPPVAYGYNPTARLAFLRATHVDPIDLYPFQYLGVDLTVPLLGSRNDNIVLYEAWQRYRWQCAYQELQMLHPKNAKPLFVEYQYGDTNWFIPWSDGSAAFDTRNPASLAPAPVSDSPRSSHPMPIFAFTLTGADTTPDLHNLVKDDGKAWGGFVVRLERNKKSGTLPFAAMQRFLKTVAKPQPAPDQQKTR